MNKDKKKRYNICMDEHLHDRLVNHAKRRKFKSFSDLISRLGAMALMRKRKGDSYD